MEDSHLGGNPESNQESNPDSNPLDAYSQIVSGVAERLTPKVASLRVPRGGQGGGYGRGESLGSGVVFTGDGFLLTNAHVVGKSTGGTAEFSDGTSAPFRVVGADPLSDLAVLRANGPTPEPAELGEADQLKVGQLVVAVGNPLGLAGSVAAGGPADRAGLRSGDLLLTVAGHPVGVSQDLQRLMFSEAIGKPLAITVMRNGALVDVIAQPSELVNA